VNLDLGQSRWVDPNQQGELESTGNGPAEVLRFDFKTKPLSKEMLDKLKKHEHPKG
jgi:hypothetical protein